MLSELGRRPTLGGVEGSFGDEFENEIGMLLREQRRQDATADDRERELNMCRSGSAPPTVEGSLSAVGGLFGGGGGVPAATAAAFPEFSSEEELRSDPAYLQYYYSNVNLNPRLPPPLLSKEDWRFQQRMKAGGPGLGGIGDKRKSGGELPPGFGSRKMEASGGDFDAEKGREWGNDGLIGLPSFGLGNKQKSLAEIIQDDLGRPSPVTGVPSRPASRNAFDDNGDSMNSTEGVNGIKNSSTAGPPCSYSYAAVLGASMSRSTTPDPQLIARAPSPCLTPIGGGRVGASSEKRSIAGPNSFNNNDPSDLAAALSGMNLSNGDEAHFSSHAKQDHSFLFGSQGENHNKHPLNLKKSEHGKVNNGSNSYVKGSPTSTLNAQYQQLEASNPSFANYGLSGYPAGQPFYDSLAGTDSRIRLGQSLSGSELNNYGRMGSPMAGGGGGIQAQYLDPNYLQYLRASEYAAAQLAAMNDPSGERGYMGNSYMNLLEIQKYLALLGPQKSQQYGVSMGGKSVGSNHQGYYGNPGFGVSFPGSPMGSPVIPNSPGSPMRHGEVNMRFPSGMRNMAGGGVIGAWHLDGGSVDEGFASSLLEEFKSNKTRSFELSEISGHVVEFSADQYGSRFIQQKLETATTDEKNMVYQEIMPQALALMTDVFGNYVIQKFFEHGLSTQRRELANKLFGHVLTLSLQMYGCRVIQKAIEVVDLDQKIKMVEELDGNIMRCVRDQNGNHVIQKCIECVPEEAIQFIISTFYDQVVTLSTHPYGCRVIQRVLEHCEDAKTQSKVMDEILGAVSMLAQDQYGNYVVQHVLEHGKPHERSQIIRELAGKIVVMSQQKFASNVVEKCLTFGGPVERELLVKEMLGTTDENEPLQAMMKDQFANYVVQKVLETCDDQQRELILSRIKVHLNALKKYTYGKHIVARVEKLVAAGERRIAAQTSHSHLLSAVVA